MKCTAAITAVLLLASNASAAFLFEIREAKGICWDCSSDGIRFEFRPWSLPVTTYDVGKTFDMPPDALQRFAALATSTEDFAPSFLVHGEGDYQATLVSYNLSIDVSLNHPKLIRHVPNIGPNLTGYTISSVTQTVNSLLVEPIGSDRYRLTGNATIRIYGEVVPEPATWVLTSIAFAAPLFHLYVIGEPQITQVQTGARAVILMARPFRISPKRHSMSARLCRQRVCRCFGIVRDNVEPLYGLGCQESVRILFRLFLAFLTLFFMRVIESIGAKTVPARSSDRNGSLTARVILTFGYVRPSWSLA